MKWTQVKLLTSLLAIAMLITTGKGVVQAADVQSGQTDLPGHAEYGQSQAGKIGITRMMNAGDELIFRVIPTNSETPIDAYYYERVTDKTTITPGGQTVRLNSLGTVGQTPSVYFCFNQNTDHSILFYGALVPNPASPSEYVMQEWVTLPEAGYTLNYPGTYYVGMKWNSRFETTSSFGFPMASVDMNYEVVGMEKVTVPAGKFKAFKIISTEKDGTLESVSWFAPELGVNIKRLSYSAFKPGYELSEANFAQDSKHLK